MGTAFDPSRRLLGAVALALAACGGEGPTADVPALHFTDVTAGSGIDFTPISGRTPSTQILEVKGGGLALLDFDLDGDLDLFVPGGATLDSPGRGPGSRLFRNEGGLAFRDVTEELELELDRWGFGTCVGDYDGDGLDDVFVACYGANALLRNTGSGRFVEVTEQAGLAGEVWSTAASFGDLDGDGDLDLYVANYLVFDPEDPPPSATFLGADVFGGPVGLPAERDFLYENLGDGTFRDVTSDWGCAAPPPSFGLGVVILDLDGDGRQDVYVGNDSQANFLFHNLGGGQFEEVGVASGAGLDHSGAGQATMGIAVADVTGNGFADLFTTNFMNDVNTLHLNLGELFFEDRTRAHGLGAVSSPLIGWAAGFFDFDHDADEDLLVLNGHTYPAAITDSRGWGHAQEPLLFARQGGRFDRVPASVGGVWLDEKHCDRGAAFGDLDGDGDVDFVARELNGPLRVLRNDGGAGHWLIVELQDSRAGIHNVRGLGARVELVSEGPRQTRWLLSCGSYQSASAPVAHFGLGDSSDSVDLEVTWPDGFVQIVEDVASDGRFLVVREEGAGE